jgi:hypothetical protein
MEQASKNLQQYQTTQGGPLLPQQSRKVRVTSVHWKLVLRKTLFRLSWRDAVKNQLV